MNKIKSVIEEVKTAASVIRFIVGTIICLSVLIPTNQYNFEKAVNEAIKPIVNYVVGDYSRMVVKNVEKINKDPTDLKIGDVEFILNNREILKNSSIQNKVSLYQQVSMLEKWYQNRL